MMSYLLEYKQRIHEYFLHKRGEGLILSPRNWLTIEKWENMGIPLHIVINGIDKTFEKVKSHSSRSKRICYLAYCEPEILNLWKEYQEKVLPNLPTPLGSNLVVQDGGRINLRDEDKKAREQVAKGQVVKEQGDRECLVNKIDQLIRLVSNSLNNQESLRLSAKAMVEEKLRALRQEVQGTGWINVESIEKRLKALDEEWLKVTISCLPLTKAEELHLAAEKKLQTYQHQMTEDAYQETIQVYFIELVRKEMKIEKLSLYTESD